jgi:cell division protein FtsZ
MGTSTGKGERRALEAAQRAIASPLLEAGAIDGARGILLNITGSSSLKLAEVYEASTIIQSAAHEDANIIFGAVLDEKMKDEVKITVIATGFRADGRIGHGEGRTATAVAIQQARQARWTPPVAEPQIKPRADAGYEPPAPEAEPEHFAPEPPARPVEPPVSPVEPPRRAQAAEVPQPPAPSQPPTRIWEAVQTTRPAPAPDFDSAEENDQLDVPAYLRKRNQQS